MTLVGTLIVLGSAAKELVPHEDRGACFLQLSKRETIPPSNNTINRFYHYDKTEMKTVGRKAALKTSTGASKYRAHYDHKYDRYDMASLFDYADTSYTCETDTATTAQELVDQVNVIRHVLDYRVGDVINKKGQFWLESRQSLMDSRYAGTALQAVLRSCPDLSACTVSIEDFGKQLSIIGEANGFSIPGNDTILAYIRAGDVIENSGAAFSVGAKLLLSVVQDGIRAALEDPAGYKRLEFVVVEAYADRADHGVWMYTEGKHDENRRQLREVLQNLLEVLCADQAQPISFGVVSLVNADETLFYLKHARMIVGDKRNNGGFTTIGEQLAKAESREITIL